MELLTQHQTAEVTRLSGRTLERHRLTGTGPKFVRLGRRVFYRQNDVEAWIAERVYFSTSEADARDLRTNKSGSPVSGTARIVPTSGASPIDTRKKRLQIRHSDRNRQTPTGTPPADDGDVPSEMNCPDPTHGGQSVGSQKERSETPRAVVNAPTPPGPPLAEPPGPRFRGRECSRRNPKTFGKSCGDRVPALTAGVVEDA